MHRNNFDFDSFEHSWTMSMTRDMIKSGPRPRQSASSALSSASSPCRFLLIAISLALLLQPTFSLYHPLTREIRARQSDCIYKLFDHGDFATFEIYIVDADDDGKPQAGVTIEGPIASAKVGQVDAKTGERTWDKRPIEGSPSSRQTDGETKLGAALQDWIVNWPAYVRKNHNNFQENGIIHHAFHIDYTRSAELEDTIESRADLTRKKNEVLLDEHRKIAAQRKKKYSGNEDADDEEYEEEDARKIQKVVPDWLGPYEWTKPIKAGGWYRMCVQADNYIAVEMDIRSSADLGGINRKTWHVYTHDEREDLDEEARILELEESGLLADEAEAKSIAEELDKALKNQVEGYDLESTRKLMSEVIGLVAQVTQKQQEVHKRIKVHKDGAERNHRRILRSGLIETVLYLVITLFQVYTVHKWLLGSNMLGR